MFQIWRNISIKKGNWLVWCNHMIMDSCSRTSLEEIVNVSQLLKLFTLAQLFFVLHENSTLSLFDVNRIKKLLTVFVINLIVIILMNKWKQL